MSGSRPDTWMPLYWGDYLRDTMHLSTTEHGAYLLLIAHYWMTGAPLPSDEKRLRLIARMSEREWKESRSTLLAFFSPDDDGLRHKRIDHEMGRASGVTTARSESGSKGAAKRWRGHTKADAKPMARPLANERQTTQQNDAPSQPQPERGWPNGNIQSPSPARGARPSAGATAIAGIAAASSRARGGG